jgi:UDP-N-acetylglucosamine 2-epimerase (non-hydrolysing)
VIHTGQHYDERMSAGFFAALGLDEPEVNLGVGSGSHAAQTAAMLVGIEQVLVEQDTDWVLSYGDTNSTVAAALAASKLRLPTAHLEAGLRSFNRSMPEELNRVAADHLSDLLLAPTQAAYERLTDEGLSDRTEVTGDVMVDVLLDTRNTVCRPDSPANAATGLEPGFVLATIHRPSNTDDPKRLDMVLESLSAIPSRVLLPVHPRLEASARAAGLRLEEYDLDLVPPLDYPSLVLALTKATGVVTDSGGLQKEAYVLGVPCTTLRAETEWTETLIGDWNVLDPDLVLVGASAARIQPSAKRVPYFGTGTAAEAVVNALRGRLSQDSFPPRG